MKLMFFFQNDLWASLSRTFIARGFAAFGGLLLMVVLGRLYGPSGVGVFALSQSIYLGAAILARYGMDNALMRYVGQDHRSGAIRKYLSWAIGASLLLSVLSAVIIFFLRDNFGQWFSAPMLANVLPFIAIAIPAFTLSFVLGGFMKGIRKPATSCLLENGSISLVTAVLILAFNTFLPVSIVHAGWAIAIAAWLVVSQGFLQIALWLKSTEFIEGGLPVGRQAFMSSSWSFFLMSLAGFMQQVLGIMIAGYFLSSAELGLFRSAQSAAQVIMFVLLVINAVFPPRFSSLHLAGDRRGLEKLAKKGTLIGVCLALPLLALFIIFPELVLGLFGGEFSHGDNVLRIIALAQFVNVATGSSNFLLNMTGNERVMRNIALASNAIGLIMFFILIPLLGVLGAALSLALVLVLQNICALICVWYKLKICILPLPSYFKFLWREPAHRL